MTAQLPELLRQRLSAVATSPHLLVCTDYDGTLAPLADRPELARLLPGAFELLHSLARLPATRVAVVSGRGRDNLIAHSSFGDPLILVGSHGAEMPGQLAPADDVERQIDQLVRQLSPLCSPSHGAWLERKPFGITVHVRGVAEQNAQRLLAEVQAMVRGWPAFHLTEGKAVLELSLAKTNKGEAIRQLASRWGTGPALVFLGDDVSDESAFAALGAQDVGIKVGTGPSCAAYRVASEDGALAALGAILASRTASASALLAQGTGR